MRQSWAPNRNLFYNKSVDSEPEFCNEDRYLVETSFAFVDLSPYTSQEPDLTRSEPLRFDLDV